MDQPSTLIIGYGNPDRQDDGVAWHVLTLLASQFGRAVPDSPDEGIFPSGENPDLLFTLQLIPELAETIADYERVCFVDAHTGNVPEEIHIAEVQPFYQQSPFTHHMTPQTVLSLAQSIYKRTPQAMLVSVRGYEFGFTRDLSAQTGQLAGVAVTEILQRLGYKAQ